MGFEINRDKKWDREDARKRIGFFRRESDDEDAKVELFIFIFARRILKLFVDRYTRAEGESTF